LTPCSEQVRPPQKTRLSIFRSPQRLSNVRSKHSHRPGGTHEVPLFGCDRRKEAGGHVQERVGRSRCGKLGVRRNPAEKRRFHSCASSSTRPQRHDCARPARQSVGNRWPFYRDARADRRLHPDGSQGPERSHSAGFEDPCGPNGDDRSAPDQGAEAAVNRRCSWREEEPMCPACITSVAMIVASKASTGALSTLVVKGLV